MTDRKAAGPGIRGCGDDAGSKASGYRKHLARFIRDHSERLAAEWLDALVDVVPVERSRIFPTDEFLDHVPQTIETVATVILKRGSPLALSESAVSHKALQLGALRHRQRATVNQILREYDLLFDVLARAVEQSVESCPSPASAIDAMECLSTISRVTAQFQNATVDAFVARYTGTIQHQTDRLQALNALLGHELRSPLQSAALNLEMLRMELEAIGVAGDLHESLDGVQHGLEQATELLNNVDGLMAPTGLVVDDMVHQQVDLTSFVNDVFAELSDDFSDRDIDWSVEDLLGTIEVDPSKLRMILTNLLSNTIKYIDPQKTQREVRVRSRVSTSAHRVRFAVCDNGLGIDPAQQEKVFELRERAHEELDDAHGVSGHGLGLYLVAETLKAIGGEISLESEPGRGSEFVIELPGVSPRG